MTDRRLRELWRRALETRSVEDERAYIVEARRSGVLDEARVRLASYLGHPGARAILEVEVPIDSRAWVPGLTLAIRACGPPPTDRKPKRRGREDPLSSRDAYVRMAVAAAETALPIWEEHARDPLKPIARDALASIREWLESPDRESLDRLRQREVALNALELGGTSRLLPRAATEAGLATGEALRQVSANLASPAGVAFAEAKLALEMSGVERARAVTLLSQAIARELIPWTLGLDRAPGWCASPARV
jgi:hypothetical protein